MKAIRVHETGGPEVLKWEDVPDPQPGPGQVTVRVHAAGVNPFEAYMRAGQYGAVQLPFTPGVDAGGVVLAVGEGVDDLTPGRRVYVAGTLSGTYAEITLCERFHVYPLPERCSFAQGAALGVPYGTAYQALFHKAQAAAGEVVLIHGASGGVGSAAVQWARAAGLTVIGTAGSEKGLALVKDLGADHALDHNAADFEEKIKGLTAGKGVDVILEMLANVNLGKDLTLLAPHGRVVVIGCRDKVEIDPRIGMGKDLSILCMSLNNATPDQWKSIHTALADGLEKGSINPVIGQEIPLAEAPRAHQAIMESGSYGKIVMTT